MKMSKSLVKWWDSPVQRYIRTFYNPPIWHTKKAPKMGGNATMVEWFDEIDAWMPYWLPESYFFDLTDVPKFATLSEWYEFDVMCNEEGWG